MLNRGILQVLQQCGEVFVCPGTFPEEQWRMFGLRADSVERLKQSPSVPSKPLGLLGMLLIRKYDIICHYPGMGSIKSTTEYLRKRLPLLLVYTLLRIRGYKIIYPSTAWPLEEVNGCVLLCERALSTISSLYGIRDKAVANTFQERGLRKTEYLPDVFFLNAENPPPTPSQGDERTGILISLRCSLPELKTESANANYKQALFNKAIALVKHYAQERAVTLSYQCMRDREFMQEIHAAARKSGDVRLVDRFISPEEALGLYAEQALVISNRLHCVLFAYLAGSRGVTLTDVKHHEKLVGALKTYGTECYALNAESAENDFLEGIQSYLDDAHMPERMLSIALEAKETTTKRLKECL